MKITQTLSKDLTKLLKHTLDDSLREIISDRYEGLTDDQLVEAMEDGDNWQEAKDILISIIEEL